MALKAVVRALIEMHAAGERIYGYPLAKRAGISAGALYPILIRLEHNGCLTSSWEPLNEDDPPSRPRRRYYQLAEGWDPLVLL